MRILGFVLAIMLTAVCLAACGGDEEEEATPVAAGTPAATEEAPAAEETTAATEEAPGAEETPAAAEEALTPGSLGNLNSYRYSMKMELKGLESILAESVGGLTGGEAGALADTLEMEVEGAFVAPDKAEARIRIGGLDDELAMTVIGNQQWVKMGDLTMGPMESTEDVSEMNLAEAMWGGFSEEAGELTCASEKKETVNDVPSRYCGIDQATFEELASLFGGTEEMGDIDELSLDLWLAEDGDWPVRLRAHVAGSDEEGQEFEAGLEMDITDVNKEIDIKPPS